MRAIAIADDDSLVGHLDTQAEVLLALGDLWESTIERAASLYGSKTTLAVKGNHDSAAPFPTPIQNAHLAVAEVGGLLFGGFAGSWKYKPRGHHLFEQYEVHSALSSFPRVDVFIAHNSPGGYHERDNDTHQGFSAFTDYIDRAEPRLFIHGHQHTNAVSQRNNTTILGVFGEVNIDLACNVR